MSGFLAALGTLFAPAAGAAVAGIGSTLLGGIVSGIGTAMMERSAEKRAEARRIAEEKRREARYAGAGDAVRFWETDSTDNIDTTATSTGEEVMSEQHVEPHKAAGTPLGMNDIGAFSNKPPPVQQQFTYDPSSGTIKRNMR